MGTITLSVPDKLKHRMDRVDWVNWSSVARHAFSEKLGDIVELELMRKVSQISEIAENDSREVRESIARDVERSVERASEDLKSGKAKPMTPEELEKLMGLR